MPAMARVPDAIARVTRPFSGYPQRWGIAGGWALDLWRGEITREHHDVDVAVLRDDQVALRAHLAGYEWTVIDQGKPRPSASGVPVLAPEIVLLYKAKHRRAVDEADFRAHAPLLPAAARAWLADALAICHPQHAWLAALA